MTFISLKQAAEEAGMHYMTVYRWVRTGRLPAVKVGGAWQVAPDDLAAMLASGADGDAGRPGNGRPRPSRTAGSGRAAVRDRLKKRLLAGDESGVWGIVEEALTSGAEPAQVHLELLLPAMRSIGDDWQAGEVEIAAEHQASAVALRVIGRLGPRFTRRGRRRGQVVCGAAPGDHHQIPIAVASDLLRGQSYDVLDLGANPPAASFAWAAAGADRCVAVVVAVTTADNVTNVRAVVDAVRDAAPGVAIVVGGPGLPAGLADELGVVKAESLADLVSVVEASRDG